MSNAINLDGQRRALVVHEWFATIGGSENVANAIRHAFPGSDLVCLWRDRQVVIPGQGRVLETILAARPFHGRKVLSLPFMPIVWRWTKARKHLAEVVIVSSHLFAHHVAVAQGTPKLLYVHTPARYIWEPALDGRGDSVLARAASVFLKPLDRKRAAEATGIAANSEFVRSRIKSAWGRDARVIYPPVDVEEIIATPDWALVLDENDRAILDALPHRFVLGASRFIPYKRLDLAIRGGELSNLPVVIAGSGPEEAKLRQLAMEASVPVHIVLRPSNSLLRAIYQRATVFVFPPIEDFGIMPVEAIALGTPVVSNGIGGASETVVDGVTGAYFKPDDDASLAFALMKAMELDRANISSHAVKFSLQRFQSEILQWVEESIRSQQGAKSG
ncbi:glycosyltransferase [Arthrobacter sp. UYCu723]